MRWCRECDDIIYIESIGYTRVVHTWGGVYEEMRKTLSSLLEELDGLCPGRFFSPYRGYIVNLDHIATITPAHIEMRDGSRILMGHILRLDLLKKSLKS